MSIFDPQDDHGLFHVDPRESVCRGDAVNTDTHLTHGEHRGVAPNHGLFDGITAAGVAWVAWNHDNFKALCAAFDAPRKGSG